MVKNYNNKKLKLWENITIKQHLSAKGVRQNVNTQIFLWGVWSVETYAKTTMDTVKMKMESMLNVQLANNFYCLQHSIYECFNLKKQKTRYE